MEEKLSEKLYKFNAFISVQTFIKKERLTLNHQEELNKILAETITVLRENNL